MELLNKDLEALIKFHGHLCPGLVLGYRVAKIAMKQLHVKHSNDEELIAIVENDSCAVDSIQFITGCTFGKGNLIFKDYGKNVYSFIVRNNGQGIRISFKGNIFEKEKNQNKQIKLLFDKDESDLFDIKNITIQPPSKAKIYPSITCSSCGEPVMETRLKKKLNKLYCIPCYDKLGEHVKIRFNTIVYISLVVC